ncbi:MAG: YicC family protein [Clostridia bacterium]|nr:YicC family protein [Clostridia bacterium]
MLSMTGYGRAEYVQDGINLVVEIKTVNNRVLDINTKMPRSFIAFDDLIRKTVGSLIKRGRVDLFINFSDTRSKPVNLDVNLEKALAYYNVSKMLSEKLGLENDFSITQVMKLPEVVEDNMVEDYSDLTEIIKNTVENACKNLNLMRLIEGEKLVDDLLGRMNVIEETVGKISERAPLVALEYKQKLTERISEALLDVKYDQARLLQEVAFFTDKSNIDEELTRLKSHVNQFRTIIEGNEVGKKLDFLMQEFNRESNTICSKSNDLEVTNLALSLKNEIEKVREQVQNLE